MSENRVKLPVIIVVNWHISCDMKFDVLVIVLPLNAMTIMRAFLSRRDWRTYQDSVSQSCPAGDGDGGHSYVVCRMRLGRFIRGIV